MSALVLLFFEYFLIISGEYSISDYLISVSTVDYNARQHTVMICMRLIVYFLLRFSVAESVRYYKVLFF